jgi:hypothetical protein
VTDSLADQAMALFANPGDAPRDTLLTAGSILAAEVLDLRERLADQTAHEPGDRSEH